MNPIKEIYELQKKDYHIRYQPVVQPNDQTVHVLYMACLDNATGLYSSIIPAVELNKTKTHQAIVNHIQPYSQESQHKPFEVMINDEILLWADYICFNTVVFKDMKADLDAIRSINKKPGLQFVMHIDDNYHVEKFGENKKLAATHRDQLLKNMSYFDVITSPSIDLVDTYGEVLLQNGYKLPKFKFQPNLMSNDCYSDVTITNPKPKKLQMGIMLNPTQYMDIAPMRKVLMDLNKKYADKLDIVLFGWDATKKPSGNAIQGVKYNYTKPVSVSNFFSTLANLHLDFAIMPLLDNEFNRCKSYHKLLQYSQIGIPTVVSNVKPYTDVLAPDGESIYSIGYIPAVKCNNDQAEWMDKIEFMINNEGARKMMGEKANICVQEKYTWHKNIAILTDEIFKPIK